ncbi:MAG: hypothetical protein V8S12_05510 [Lachnospiraceae bacterium]
MSAWEAEMEVEHSGMPGHCQREKAEEALPLLFTYYKNTSLYKTYAPQGDTYSSYWDGEHLLPEAFEKVVRQECVKSAQEEKTVIEALRKLTNGKKVLILGYGREGRATWQLLCRAGGCKEIAIADRNEKLYEEGAVMHTGPDYLEHLEEYDLVFKTQECFAAAGVFLPLPDCVTDRGVLSKIPGSDCWNYRYKRKKHHDYSFVPHFERSWKRLYSGWKHRHSSL